MPSGASADPIYLSSDSEEGGDITRGMLGAAAKGKGRATDTVPDATAPDADQGVGGINTENQTAYTGGADVSVNGARASTPVKPSFVPVGSGVLPQKLQSSSTCVELNQRSSTGLKNQQGIGRISPPPLTSDSMFDDPANPFDPVREIVRPPEEITAPSPLQVPLARRSARSTNAATMPTIAEDIGVSIDASTIRLAAQGNAKTDMADVAQLLRRSLSIADANVGAVNQTSTSKLQRVTTESIIYIPAPSPRPAFTLISAPTPHQTNAKNMVSDSHPNLSAASGSYSQRESASHQIHDGSSNQLPQEQTVRLMEVLRLLETKETHYESLKKQIIKEQNDIGHIKNIVQRLLLDQGQSIPSTAVANQSSPEAVPSRKKNKTQRKEKTDIPTLEITANANAKKGKKKAKFPLAVAPVGTEPGRKMTKAERKAERKAAIKQWQQAEKKLIPKAEKKLPLGFAPAFLEADQHPWEVYSERCIRPFSWSVLNSLPVPISHIVERKSSVQFPNPIFWIPSPSNPETIMRPHPKWTLGTFQNKDSPALSPRVLRADNIPVARCNIRSLISWFQLFGALVYVEHAGSADGWAVLEYADPLGAWRAMICEFPAWGDLTVSVKYASLMEVKGYGQGREKGRTTVPLGGIRAGTSASDGMMGNRGVKRSKEETEIEDGEIDAHFGIPVSPPRLPIAGPSRPGIMPRRWLTKVIDGQEYIIVDSDGDDHDIMVHSAPPINAAIQLPSKHKRVKRRRPQRAVSRAETIKSEPMEVEAPPPADGLQVESSGREDEADAEVQDEELEGEYDELDWTEDEDENSSGSEASSVEIPEPEPSTMMGRI